MAKLVANSYGNALFELALEKNNLDDMLEEITCLQTVFRENADFRKFLSHPQISKEEKISVIENTFKGKADNDIVGLLVLIVKKDRYNEIDAIFNYFISRVKEYKHIGVAYITSAIPLEDAKKKAIENRLIEITDYVEFEMNYSVDKDILGGLMIRIGDRVVDNTLKSKITSMSKKLEKIHIS